MSSPEAGKADLSVLHIGAGRYRPDDRTHPTFRIWRELAAGFRQYTVVGRSTERAASRIREGNLTVHLLPSHMAREAEFLLTQFRAIRIARNVDADVVVAQSPALGGLAGLAIRRWTRARLLVEFHTVEFFDPFPPGSPNWFLQLFSRPALNRADRIRVLSDGMKARAVTKYGRHLENRIAVLPPRVDLDLFPARPERAPDGRLRVVTTGSVIRRKRQLELVTTLLKSGLPIRLEVIGDGPELNSCKAVAEELGGRDQVIFHGRLTHADLSDILRAADVFVLFSSHEGTPRAIMEAMAVGLPVITTDAGFCADIVAHGTEGFVLGSDPEAELPALLQRLHQDPALRNKMGRAGRERAIRDYDSVRLYERYKALIRETAAS